jgi:arylsulfatase A-like enzyme
MGIHTECGREDSARGRPQALCVKRIALRSHTACARRIDRTHDENDETMNLRNTVAFMFSRVRTRIVACAGAAACVLAGGAAAAPPHIVYILADDLGWREVGFHQGSIPTPNLDRLARDGAALNALYAQPHSSQTHAAVLTGRYPMRYGLQTMSVLPVSAFGLPKEERTLADDLRQAGYATAFVGLWRLGHARSEYWPTRRGFDAFFGTLSASSAPGAARTEANPWRRNETPFAFKRGSNATELLAKEAQRVIERHDRSRPLFLMLSLPTPASGEASAALAAQFRHVSDAGRRTRAASVAETDRAVGDVLAALERAGLLASTVLVFHSDNGGSLPMRHATGDGDAPDFGADNGVFRAGKGSLYEGGVRVAGVFAWPGRVRPGTVVSQAIHVTDLNATLLRIAEAPPSTKPSDGVDVLGVISDGQLSPRRQMLLNVEPFRGALRVNEWKLIVHAALPPKVELYNLSTDPEEAENVAARHPERVRELQAALNEYAYDMVAPLYLEELVAAEAARRPIVWGQNPVAR